MADIICIVGSKGGTGKTTLTHMLGQGLSQLGYLPVCISTEYSHDQNSRYERAYCWEYADSLDSLKQRIEEIRGQESIGIIDGGHALTNNDSLLYKLADLVILPFRDSSEDTRAVLRDLRQFPKAYLLPSQWPTNPWQLRRANRLIDESLGHYRDRMLDPSFVNSTTKALLHEQTPDAMPTALNSVCVNVARQIVSLLNLRPQIDASRRSASIPSARKIAA